MTGIAQDICEQIKQTVIDGDLARLKSLAKQFPDGFESFRKADVASNLVDSAWNGGHNDVTIYLIVEHGFEVSPQFKTERKEYFGANEYHFEYGA